MNQSRATCGELDPKVASRELVKPKPEAPSSPVALQKSGGPSIAELNRRRLLAQRNYKHGLCDTTTYISWRAMLARCYNPKHIAFRRYGGAGITVCNEWIEFANFLADMGARPSGKTLDRIDGSKGYSKSNCRWATRAEQGRNKIDNVWLEWDGLRLTQSEWSRLTGIGTTTICWRIKRGWPVSKILAPLNS